MEGTDWILLDTETTGFVRPIYVVEIAAQRMNGWEPIGPPFEKLINQNADILLGHLEFMVILEKCLSVMEKVQRMYVKNFGLTQLAYHSYLIIFDMTSMMFLSEWIRLSIKPIGEKVFVL